MPQPPFPLTGPAAVYTVMFDPRCLVPEIPCGLGFALFPLLVNVAFARPDMSAIRPGISIDTRPEFRNTLRERPNIGGPRRNKEMLTACLAAGEAGVAARSTFCDGLRINALRGACRELVLESMQKWQNWCYWWWG